MGKKILFSLIFFTACAQQATPTTPYTCEDFDQPWDAVDLPQKLETYEPEETGFRRSGSQ